MSAEMTTGTAAPAVAAKGSRTSSVSFRGEAGTELRLVLETRRDGSARTYAVHSTREGKKVRNARGATQRHASAEAARAAQDRLAAQAVKQGWVRKERVGGFAPKPDAFDAAHLPAPAAKARK